VSASLTPAGRSCHTSSYVATSFAPCLISVFGPQEFWFVTLPGTAKTSRFCSRAQPAVTVFPNIPQPRPPEHPPSCHLVSDYGWEGSAAQRMLPTEFRNESSPKRQNLLRQTRIFFRINYLNPRPKMPQPFCLCPRSPRDDWQCRGCAPCR
jgi:hypothetical protein